MEWIKNHTLNVLGILLQNYRQLTDIFHSTAYDTKIKIFHGCPKYHLKDTAKI